MNKNHSSLKKLSGHASVEEALRISETHKGSLLRLSRELEQAETYSQILESALEEVKRVIGYRNIWVYLLSDDGETASLLSVGGPAADLLMKEIPVLRIKGSKFLEEAVSSDAPVIVEDALTDPRTTKEIVAKLQIRSIISVPMMLVRRRIGALGTGTFGTEGICTPDTHQVEFLSAMASQVAVAIHRVQLLAEHKRAEAALRQSEERFRTLVEQSPFSTQIFRADGSVITVNRAFCELWDASPEETKSLIAHYNILKDEQLESAALMPYIRKAFDGEFAEIPPIRYDPKKTEVVRSMGLTTKWVTGYIWPVLDANGKVREVVLMHEDITARKRGEELLRHSEEKYRHLVENIADAVYVTDENGIVSYISPVIESINGYRPTEIAGRPFVQFVSEEDLPKVTESFRRTLAGDEESLEYRVRSKSGAIRWIRNASRPIKTSGGIAGVRGVITDISPRKQGEKVQNAVYRIAQATDAAASLDDLFRLIHEIISEVMSADNFYIALYDEETNIISFPYFVDQIDVASLPHTLGKGYTEYVLRTGKSLLCDSRLDEELRRRGEVELIGASSPIWLGVPLTIDEKVIGVMVVQHYSDENAYGKDEQHMLEFVSSQVANAIDRKRRQEALDLQRSYFQELFESSPAGIVMMDEAHKVLNTNRAFAKMFQYSIDEIKGRSIQALILPKSLPDEATRLIGSAQQEDTVHTETVRCRKDGTPLSVSITEYPIRIRGKVAGLYGMYVDISERKKLEEQLRGAQKMESLGTLAGGIAHDFNNILGIILGHVSILSNEHDSPARIAASIGALSKAADRGTGLVRQLLTFARKSNALFESLSVSLAVEEIVELLSQTFPKTITITTEIEENLPDILADANQLHQVLLNLCVNARDAMPGGGTLSIAATRVHSDIVRREFPGVSGQEYIALRLTDTGTGMDEETRQRIFEPFFTTKELSKGTGLGLAVVFGIMENHHGFIRAESEVDRGTTFHLYFPIPPTSVDIFQQEKEPMQDVAGGSETILLVEDEEMLCDLLKGFLEAKGYTVLTASEGKEAVDVYERHQSEISLVLSDLGLPKLSGHDVLKQMKQLNPDVVFVLASGFVKPEQKSEILKDGAKAIIQKPYFPNEVLEKLREILDRAKIEKANRSGK